MNGTRHFTDCSRSVRVVCAQAGITLVELMISMALSLFVVLAATALFVSTKSGYLAQDDLIQIQDAGQYAIGILARAVRQAGHEDWEHAQARLAGTLPGASVMGLDARSLKARSDGIESPLIKSVNGSDVLAIRFSGTGGGDNGDGTILNCAGFGVAAAAPAEASRGWSIFYVAMDATGEPDLYCKYRGRDSWSAQSIASGVESFQVLYAVDTDADGLPNRFLNATGIDALDDALPLQGANAAQRNADRRRQSHWNKVVAVRIALLVRGAHAVRSGDPPAAYDLFGAEYAATHAASDAGVHVRESDLPKAVRNRMRKTFSTTIRLRNHGAENT